MYIFIDIYYKYKKYQPREANAAVITDSAS